MFLRSLSSFTLCTLCATVSMTAAYAADEAATDYWVRVMPSVWLADFDGSTNYHVNGAGSGDQPLSDLGLANQEVGFGLEAGFKLPLLVSLHAGGFSQETEGSFNTASFNYGGLTFTNGTSKAEISDLYLEADLRLLDLDIAGLAFGVGYHSMNNTVTLSGSGQSASLDEDFQFPVLALRAHANVPMLLSLGAEAKIHWMEISYLDNKISYLDAALQITWMPCNLFGFMGGYRYLDSSATFKSATGVNASAKFDLSLGGPFIGMIGKF
jgi:hypothetical protein